MTNHGILHSSITCSLFCEKKLALSSVDNSPVYVTCHIASSTCCQTLPYHYCLSLESKPRLEAVESVSLNLAILLEFIPDFCSFCGFRDGRKEGPGDVVSVSSTSVTSLVSEKGKLYLEDPPLRESKGLNHAHCSKKG